MNRRSRLRISIVVAALFAAPSAHAQLDNVMAGSHGGGLGSLGGGSGGGLGGAMGGGMGGGMLPGQSLTAGSADNAAGVLSFCIKNNYLGGGSASGMRDSLLGRIGGPSVASRNPGYHDGVGGILHSSSGQQIGLGGAGSTGIKAEITRKVCDQVLKQSGSLL